MRECGAVDCDLSVVCACVACERESVRECVL